MIDDGRLKDDSVIAVLKEDFPDYDLRFMTELRGNRTINRISINGALPRVSWENDVIAVNRLGKDDNDRLENLLYLSLRDEIAREISRTYGSDGRQE